MSSGWRARSTSPRASERLFFMQSNGGLTDAGLFQGKDAILSGPAGGIVGMAKTGRGGGLRPAHRLRHGRHLDRRQPLRRRLRAQLRDRGGGRPDARADDGHPHRRGGRRLDLQLPRRPLPGRPRKRRRRPGPGQLPPRRAADRHRLQRDAGQALARPLPGGLRPQGRPDRSTATWCARSSPRWPTRSPPPPAPTPSPPRRWPRASCASPSTTWPTRSRRSRSSAATTSPRYTLQCFGGAGGQHACLVADALGMRRVLIHPFAGVLSAFGMGLAEVRAMREAQLDVPPGDPLIEARLAELSSEARAEVDRAGRHRPRDPRRAAHIRYEGSHQALRRPASARPTPWRPTSRRAHEARFGFAPPERRLVVEMLAVEAVGHGAEMPRLAAPEGGRARRAPCPSTWQGAWRDVPLHDRARLGRAARIDGPAVIVEPTGTNVVEPGWRAGVDGLGNLILRAHRPRAAPARRRHRGRPGHCSRSCQQPLHVDRRPDGRDAGQHLVVGQHQGAAGLLLRHLRRRRRPGGQRARTSRCTSARCPTRCAR